MFVVCDFSLLHKHCSARWTQARLSALEKELNLTVSSYSKAAFYSVVNLRDRLKREQCAGDPLQSRSVRIKISSCTIFISADLKHLHFAAKLRCCQATAWYSARSELYSGPSCVFNLFQTLYAVFAFPVNKAMHNSAQLDVLLYICCITTSPPAW